MGGGRCGGCLGQKFIVPVTAPPSALRFACHAFDRVAVAVMLTLLNLFLAQNITIPRSEYDALRHELAALRAGQRRLQEEAPLEKADSKNTPVGVAYWHKVDLAWRRHERTNCMPGKGGPDIPRQGPTFINVDNSSRPPADRCIERCRATRGCAAVTLARPDVSWSRQYALRQKHHVGMIPKVECYLRGTPIVIDVCVADSRFDTYVAPKLACFFKHEADSHDA